MYVDDKKEAHNLLLDAVAVNNTAFSLLLLDKGATATHVDADGVTVLTQVSDLIQAITLGGWGVITH